MSVGIIFALSFFTLIFWFAFTGMTVLMKRVMEAPNWLIITCLILSIAIAVACGMCMVN